MFSNENIAKSNIVFSCEKCAYNTVLKKNYEKHCLTRKHILAMFSNAKVAKSNSEFCCEKCKYKTRNKYDYDKHCLTRKHLLSQNNSVNIANVAKSSKAEHVCPNCKKIYSDYSGLWRHKQKCNGIVDKDLIMMLIKENSDFKNIVMDVVKNGVCNNSNNGNNSNSHNNTTNNSHNKSFNLQFFLNETCKNAMNISDFADSIQLQLSDLESVGEMGYVEGISNIIVKNLSSLDISQRPIHCTDKKREVLYVKDENKWEKEDTENSKVRRLIKRVSFKNSSLMKLFREKYPEYKNGSSTVSDKYNTIVVEAMGGNSDKECKIIRNISKTVLVEKDMPIF
jgi:hypothetical protein